MIINLTNNSGYMSKRIKLGNIFYNLSFYFNYRDNCWYFDNSIDIIGVRIVQGRKLMTNDYGYLIANDTVDKLTFNKVEWVAYD